MQNITNYTQLKNAITLLESEQENSKQKLIEDYNYIYKKIRNISILANTVKSFISSSDYNVVNNATGIAAGYLIKKIVVGNSESKFRKVLGTVLQFGATRLVSHNPQIISKAGLFIMQFFPRKKQEPSLGL